MMRATSYSSPSPQSKSAVADFDHSVDGPKPAYTRFRLGEGRGGGSGDCGPTVPLSPTPTPGPSPAEPRYSEGSATQQSDRSRQQPTSVGGGEKNGFAADASEITVAAVTLVADLAGALYWPEEQLLVVSDLHLEKGSSFAARGILLPPYDTASTLERLAGILSRHAVRIVVALGDNFHDQGGPARLAAADRAKLVELQRGRDWIWIAGNHDPDPADRIGGVFAKSLALGPLLFRHEPMPQESPGEIAGHLHPVARVSRRGRTLTRRCFVSDGSRLVMPAFGAYAGGLNIRHAAFAQVFGALAFTAHLLGQRRLYGFAAMRCLADGGP
jgi:DNA ligase-associated metallophosphoesterase